MDLSIRCTSVVMFLLLGMFQGAGPDRAREQKFQQAIDLMETKGDLKGAIKLFEESAASADRRLAARSLLYLGQCQEKLGQDGARKYYSRLISEFSDQKEVAAKAKSRLEALGLGAGAPPTAASQPSSRQVWAGPETDVRGALSPDGRYFAFMETAGNLGLRDLARGESRNLTHKKGWSESSEFAYHPAFSRDGTRIAFCWENKRGFGELQVVDVDGTGNRTLHSERDWITPFDWSPDGKKILCTMQDEKSDPEIVEFTAAEGSLRRIQKIGKQLPNKLAYSFDGKYIVYDGLRLADSKNSDIMAIAVTGEQEVTWVDHPASDANPMFTPNGKGLLFTSNRTGSQALWLQPLSGGVPQGPPQLLKSDFGPRIRPLGVASSGRLFYGVANVTAEVSIAEIDLATGKLVSPPKALVRSKPGFTVMPKWSPDGKSLVYIGYENNPNESRIIVRSFPDGAERELTAQTIGPILWPRWLPDGKSILFCGRDPQENPGRIFGIEANTGKLTTLVRNQRPDGYTVSCWHPSSSPDGKKIYYGRWLEGRTHLVEFEIATGTEKVIHRDDASDDMGPMASFSGRWIAFLSGDPKTSSRALKVMPASGGEAKELIRLTDPETLTALTWTPDSSGLLYSRYKGTRSEMMELWIIPAAGGNARKLELVIPITNTLSIHPDGRRIAFDGRKGNMELWVLENFLPR